jgi:GTPase SAR1 family protein
MALPLPISYKIIGIGTSEVGKSSIIQHFLDNTFLKEVGSTSPPDFHSDLCQVYDESIK